MRNKCLRTVNEKVIRYTINHNNGSAGCNYIRNMLEDCDMLGVCENCPYNIGE